MFGGLRGKTDKLYFLVKVNSPNWTTVRKLIQSNNDLVKIVIQKSANFYILHYACNKNAPSDLVVALINIYPKALEEKDYKGWYPLHIACQYNQPELVVSLLINKYPKALQKQSNEGWTPLHVACRYRKSVSVVLLLINQYPKAVQEKDSFGDYPLHIACRYKQPDSVVLLLINKYPKAVQEKNNEGYYPLPIACVNFQSESVVLLLINEYPKAVQEKNEKNWYPLHCACSFNQSVSVVLLLINQYPKAVQEKDSFGDYPLHIACRYSQPDSVVLLLINKYPEAVQEKNNLGDYPLHCACDGNASLPVIQVVAEKWPDGIHQINKVGQTPLDIAKESVRNKETISWLEHCTYPTNDKTNGNTPTIVQTPSLDNDQQLGVTQTKLSDLVNIDTPNWIEICQLIQSNNDVINICLSTDNLYILHYACWKNAPSDVVVEFINKYPKAAQEKDKDGLYPLHYACENNQSESVVLLLIDKFPEAAQCNDVSYPLHLACQHNQSESVVLSLMNLFPRAVQEKDNFGDYLLHDACINHQSASVVCSIIDNYPEAVHKPNDEGYYPLHYACQYNQSESVISILVNRNPYSVQEHNIEGWFPLHFACQCGQSLSVVALLIDEFPEAVQKKNHEGDYALHCACASNALLLLIQYVAEKWPDGIHQRNNAGQTPLDMAKNITGTKVPNKDTISWLVHCSNPTNGKTNGNTPKIIPTPSPDNLDQFLEDRNKLCTTINQRYHQALVSEQYIHHIVVPSARLGSGYFGIVYLGIDTTLNQKFAIKTINREILSMQGAPASASLVETVQKTIRTFYKEQQVLMNFNHPNIAMLLAYSFPTNDIMGNYYLVYEYAERGSLDVFWKDDTGREQLNFKRRVIIAYEVMTALRFLHEGNDTFVSCCHRDIKSANIVLKQNLSAQLIDCGLAKFVSDDDSQISSAGVKGTPGYGCPEYVGRGGGYEIGCDVFSYGVVLTELFTGTLQNQKTSAKSQFNFSREYLKGRKPRSLVNDIDVLSGYNDTSNLPAFVHDFADLALDCMSDLIEERPEGHEIMGRLKKIFDDVHAGGTNTSYNPIIDEPVLVHDEALCQQCRTYKKYLDQNICQMCMILTELNTIKMKINDVLVKLDAILPILASLDAKFNNRIPRLFVFYPANLKSFWNNPKSWIRSQVADTYHLQFVCAHSFQAIYPPLKIRITKGWIEKVAPVLACSLYLMSMALKGISNITIDVSDASNKLYKIGNDQLRNLLLNVYSILDDCSKIDVKGCLENNTFVNVLNSGAYNEMKEMAYEQNHWQENMVLVKKPSSCTTLWVAKNIALNEKNGYEVVNVFDV